MSEINIIIKNVDGTQKADISIDDNQTGGDIIEAAVENWALSLDDDYSLTNISKTPAEIISPTKNLSEAGVLDGETLQLQQIIRAGTQSWL